MDMDEGPLDRRSTVQDIWTRLAQTFSVKVERDGNQVRLMFDLLSAVPVLPDPGLLLAALDPQSYVWHQGSIKGSFISHLEIEDDYLDFRLTPQPDGATLVSTETRVHCGDDASRRAFAWYWRAIRLGSGAIRHAMLGALKRAAEAVER